MPNPDRSEALLEKLYPSPSASGMLDANHTRREQARALLAQFEMAVRAEALEEAADGAMTIAEQKRAVTLAQSDTALSDYMAASQAAAWWSKFRDWLRTRAAAIRKGER